MNHMDAKEKYVCSINEHSLLYLLQSLVVSSSDYRHHGSPFSLVVSRNNV
jgi:hypothetical protein